MVGGFLMKFLGIYINVYEKGDPKMTTQEQIVQDKEYHLKKLLDLSVQSIGQIPQLEEPTDEEKECVLFRLSHSSTWPKVHENKIGDVKNWT